MNFQTGEILYIDKPYRWTSFDVVNKVRWLLCKRLHTKKLKVGHAGTLDPLATGVMIVCTGRATKRIDELQAHTKEYVATLRLGATTPSFDLEHPIDAYYPTEHITLQQVKDVLQQFLGPIQQIPPAYSAIKVDGKRAYDLARRDKEVELKPKLLVIDEIELLDASNLPDSPHLSSSPAAVASPFGEVPPSSATFPSSSPSIPRTGMRNKAFLTSPSAPIDTTSYPSITIRIVCSKGTYIRALARDIGQALGSGAHLTALRRTRVGDVQVDACLPMDTFPTWLEQQDIEQSPNP
ncbi:MAG: tRNA pseudouridine(55) synthase TruB [Bacteroidaceae bacterium]|nr:tRNA pseudouridine(55) synthase TruB [Bacteroidaceae bacterium]